MATAVRFIEGWDHGITPVVSGGGLASGITLTPTVGSSFARRGGFGLQCNLVAAGDESLDCTIPPNGQAVACTSVWVNVRAFQAGVVGNVLNVASVAGSRGDIGIDASGNWQFSWQSSNTGITTGPPVVLNKWTLLEVMVDMGVNPWVAKWRIDGVEQTQPTSLATAVSVFRRNGVGYYGVGNKTGEIWFDDLVTIDGTDQTMWPIGSFDIESITADQTAAAAHQTITTTEWQYGTISGSTFTSIGNFTGVAETDSRSRLNDLSIATAIRMNAGAAGQAGNGRWPVANCPLVGIPRAVAILVAHQQAAAGTSQLIARTLVGGSTTDHFNAAYSQGTTVGYLYGCMDTTPGGSAWTVAGVDALNFELDSTDSTPAIHIGGFVYQVAFPDTAPPMNIIVVPNVAAQRAANW